MSAYGKIVERHGLATVGPAIDRDVWAGDCACGAEFEADYRAGVEWLHALHVSVMAERHVARVPKIDPAVYCLLVDGDAAVYFRHDDGWRLLHDGPRSTVDRETLLTPGQQHEIEYELGLAYDGLVPMLEAARAR